MVVCEQLYGWTLSDLKTSTTRVQILGPEHRLIQGDYSSRALPLPMMVISYYSMLKMRGRRPNVEPSNSLVRSMKPNARNLQKSTSMKMVMRCFTTSWMLSLSLNRLWSGWVLLPGMRFGRWQRSFMEESLFIILAFLKRSFERPWNCSCLLILGHKLFQLSSFPIWTMSWTALSDHSFKYQMLESLGTCLIRLLVRQRYLYFFTSIHA